MQVIIRPLSGVFEHLRAASLVARHLGLRETSATVGQFKLPEVTVIGAFNHRGALLGTVTTYNEWPRGRAPSFGISGLVVNRKFRKQGIAVRLLESAFEQAEKEGHKTVIFRAEPIVLAFYSKLAARRGLSINSQVPAGDDAFATYKIALR